MMRQPLIRGEFYDVVADVHSGWVDVKVRYTIGSKRVARWRGWVNPRRGLFWKRRSLPEAVQKAMEEFHRLEFLRREAAAQIEAARAAIKAYADLEREMSA